MSTPRHVQNNVELDDLLRGAGPTRLVVVDFYADWCGPCKYIAPLFAQLAAQYSHAIFVKVNVDHSRDIAMRYAIQAMPTFLFLKNNAIVDTLRGANPNALESTIQKHYAVVQNPEAATAVERKFLDQFVQTSEKVNYYKDEISLTLARSVVPEEIFVKHKDVGLDLAFALLDWFKTSFFTWCDVPTCECGQVPKKEGGTPGTPSPSEAQGAASRVEVYRCECGRDVRFPRYNNPAKLLETRTGRCGEWANCFALLAVACGFDTRFVYDVTDHVWCELFIPSEDRWIHCDPCEASFDKPLLYEKGWGKKLSYVIAFGLDHVEDVTWRYSQDHSETLKRRRQVREAVLSKFLRKLNDRLTRGCTQDRLKVLEMRRLTELIEFVVISRKADDKCYGGRISGDETWRRVRGELGDETAHCSVTLKPSEQELTNKRMRLTYDCAKNEYSRDDGSTTSDWKSCVYAVKNVQRKVERDWQQAYLCRVDGKEDGEITWAIDLSGTDLKNIEVKLNGQTFENGKVRVVLCAGETCEMMKLGDCKKLGPMKGSLLKITATLMQGTGENAFQHAQLFRTPLNTSANELEVLIDFE